MTDTASVEAAVAEVIGTPLEAATDVIRAVLPYMRRQRSGRIINISSAAGRASLPMWGVYCATKFAVEAMSDALRLEVAPFGIQVAVIEPGAIRTGYEAHARGAAVGGCEPGRAEGCRREADEAARAGDRRGGGAGEGVAIAPHLVEGLARQPDVAAEARDDSIDEGVDRRSTPAFALAEDAADSACFPMFETEGWPGSFPQDR